MKNIFFLFIIIITVFSCNTNSSDDEKEIPDNRIALRTDTLNVVKLSDTLVIFESTCRGCAYEGSTNFSVGDSTNTIKLVDVITSDNNPPEVSGGSVSKILVFVPVKTGIVNMSLYKFWKQEKTAADSALAVSYKIEVK